jgi:pilus assembly protein CpaB
MNRSRMFTLAAVALMVALSVTLLTYRILRNRLDPPNDMTEIVVAAQNVSLGARLTEADLRIAPWPRAVPLKGSFKNPADVVGRGVIVSMIPNEPILDSKLAPEGSGAGLTAAIPDGMRAVGVKVNDVIGVAGFVVPGSRVDVILSGSPGKEGEVEMSKVILENIQVLAAGQNVTSDVNGKPQSVQVVTLLVSPEESQKLALASVNGNIQLALRNPLDLDRKNPDATRRDGLYGPSSAPAPVPAPVVKHAPVRSLSAKVEAPPAPIVVMAAPPAPAPAPPARVELQLIQGLKSEKVSFEKKQDAEGKPAGQ